jgi:ATP-grasp domain/Phosphoribosylglycinamide synthetase, ATP-grasp (A) domain
MKPVVLIFATARWFSTARLAMGLANAGFTVDALCLPQHPLAKTSIVPRPHIFNPVAPLSSVANAISACKPTIVVPADDLAAYHLHQLYDHGRGQGEQGASLCALIERSLGSSESFRILEARASLIHIAEEEGIRVPKTSVIANRRELKQWLSGAGLPVVLKANGTSGGTGVRIASSEDEAIRAFDSLHSAPPSYLSPIQAWWRKSKAIVWPSLPPRRVVVNAQAHVIGRDAISEVACWKGVVLAELGFEVLTKQYARGPASVLRVLDNAEMSLAIEKVVRRLNLSGLHGFDFILEEQTGKPYLIEMNPRATQIGHLTLGPGHDLPAALYAAASGDPIQPVPAITEKDTIALFPQEWIRDRRSAFLLSAYHDVPWQEPEFIRACVEGSRVDEAPRKLREQGTAPSGAGAPLTALRAGKLPGAD